MTLKMKEKDTISIIINTNNNDTDYSNKIQFFPNKGVYWMTSITENVIFYFLHQ